MNSKPENYNVFRNAISPFESKDQGASDMAGDEKNKSKNENENQEEIKVENEEE